MSFGVVMSETVHNVLCAVKTQCTAKSATLRTAMHFSDPHSRLRWARAHANFATAKAAAVRHGWNINTYRSHENGNRGFDASDSEQYAKAFGVKAQWLTYGRFEDAPPSLPGYLREKDSPESATPAAPETTPRDSGPPMDPEFFAEVFLAFSDLYRAERESISDRDLASLAFREYHDIVATADEASHWPSMLRAAVRKTHRFLQERRVAKLVGKP